MAQIFTGARAVLSINGHVVGFASGVNVTVEDTLTDVDVLGQLAVGDLAETAHKCNFSFNHFKAIKADGNTIEHGIASSQISSAYMLGIDSSFTDDMGAAATKGVVDGSVQLMRSQTYFNCEIIDDLSTGNLAIFKMVDCKYSGGTGTVDARGVWTGVWNFKARKGFGI